MTMLKELVGRNMEEIAYGGKVVVETINLSVLYGKRYAIRDISLKVEKNRITNLPAMLEQDERPHTRRQS
jgi:hypothetical protein